MEQENVLNSSESSEGQMENVSEQLNQIVESANVASVENVVTPQTSTMVEYAGFWTRFAANLVDGLVLLIPSAILQGIVGRGFGGTMVGLILTWSYAIYMLNTRQATLGKIALGLKVTTVSGDKPTIGKLALREIVGKILNVITLGIGYLIVAFTQKKQGLHDMIADTVVVYDPALKRRRWLVVLSVIFAMVIPVGILAGIVLVSTNNARQKAMDAKLKAEQRVIDAQVQTQQ